MNGRVVKRVAPSGHARRSERPVDDAWIVEMEPLDIDSCWRLLAGGDAVIGRLGFVYDYDPLVLPVNFFVIDRSIIVRTGFGTLVHATASLERVTFEVDHVEPTKHIGWSVLVTGCAVEIDDADLPEAARHLESWAPGPRSTWIRIVPATTTGRFIYRRRSPHADHLLPYMTPD